MHIKLFQKRYGLTNKDMAEICQCSLPTIQKWRSGEVAPSGAARQLMRLLDHSAQGKPDKLRKVLSAMNRELGSSTTGAESDLQHIESSMSKVMDRLELMLEARRKDRQLAESEERYRSMVESSLNPICRWQPDTTLTFVNQAYADLFARHGDNLVGRKWIEFVPEDRRRSLLTLISDMVRRGEPDAYIHEALDKEGRVTWQEWRDIPIKNDVGDVTELHSVGRDLTEVMRLREEASEHGRMRSTLMALCGHPILVFDEEGAFIEINTAFEATFPGAGKWKYIADMIPSLTTGHLKKLLRRLRTTGQMHYRMEVDGRMVSLEARCLVDKEPRRRYLGVFHIEDGPAREIVRTRLSREAILEEAEVEIPFDPDKLREVESMMAETGKALRVSRVVFFTFDDKISLMDNVLEWCAEGIEPQHEGLRRLPTAAYAWWTKRLQKNQLIKYEDISEMPRTASREYEVLKAQGICSVLTAPLIVGDTLKGFVGVDQVGQTRLWHRQEIKALETLRGKIEDAMRASASGA